LYIIIQLHGYGTLHIATTTSTNDKIFVIADRRPPSAPNMFFARLPTPVFVVANVADPVIMRVVFSPIVVLEVLTVMNLEVGISETIPVLRERDDVRGVLATVLIMVPAVVWDIGNGVMRFGVSVGGAGPQRNFVLSTQADVEGVCTEVSSEVPTAQARIVRLVDGDDVKKETPIVSVDRGLQVAVHCNAC
jgi:hypothetical protein